MSLINDFWTYCQCYEIPRNYAVWSAVGLLSAATHRKVYIRHGDLVFHANMYITLVGEQGSSKSTSKDFARQFLLQVYPDMPMSPSMTTREKIVEIMCGPDAERFFINEDNESVSFRPYVAFINELKNYVSFNPAGMLSFLTDIYDVRYFDAATIKRGLEQIENPTITILACETPEWIVEKMKTQIISGGFSRRMLYIYETDTNIVKPRPYITADARQAALSVVAHLESIKSLTGEYKWTDSAKLFWDEWYTLNRKTLPDDSAMRGYRRTKHVQLLKLCMLIGLSEPTPKLIMSDDLLQLGLAHLDDIETNMPKLFVASGRNELAAPAMAWMDLMERHGGWLPEGTLMEKALKDMNPMEQYSTRRHFAKTKQIIYANVPVKSDGNGGYLLDFTPGAAQQEMAMLPQKFVEITKQIQVGKL